MDEREREEEDDDDDAEEPVVSEGTGFGMTFEGRMQLEEAFDEEDEEEPALQDCTADNGAVAEAEEAEAGIDKGIETGTEGAAIEDEAD